MFVAEQKQCGNLCTLSVSHSHQIVKSHEGRIGIHTNIAGGAGDQDTLLGRVNGRTTMSGREVQTLREGFSEEGMVMEAVVAGV